MHFTMVGKLKMSKETEKWKPYSETKYDSGWVKRRLVFNVVSGDNRHMMTVDGGSFADGHGDVYLISKSYIDNNGNKVKGENFTIPFKDRHKQKHIDETAEFRKFVFDLGDSNIRYKLQNAADAIKEGKSITDAELKAMGIESEDQIETALTESKKKRHEFLTEWDFAEFVKKVIDSGKYDNCKFKIVGDAVYNYSDKNERFYSSYLPKRISLVSADTPETSIANVKLLFGENAIDEDSFEDTGKIYVNGYMMEYDNNRKKQLPVPMTIVLMKSTDPSVKDPDALLKGIKRKFTTEGDNLKEYGVNVEMIDGSQKVEISDDMLTDEQREDIECGLITKEELIADLGGSVYGDRVQEFRFYEVGYGYRKGVQDTVYTMEDMVVEPLVEDIFDDDDDI